MAAQRNKPTDDPSTAPESGTNRDRTSGNQPSNQPERSAPGPSNTDAAKERDGKNRQPDDPSVAGEER